MKRPTQLLIDLLNDLRRLQPDVVGLDRDIVTIKHRCRSEGLGFLTKALPSFLNAVENGLEEGRFACPLGFERITKRDALPKLFSGLLRKLFDRSGLLLEKPSIECILSIRQIGCLFKKLLVENDVDKLHLESARKFIKDDESVIDVFDDTLTHRVNMVCRYLLPNLDSDIEAGCGTYNHGPGAVAERLSPNRKWTYVSSFIKDKDLDLFPDLNELSQFIEVDVPQAPLEINARFVSVPKNSVSRRAITVEPVANQFLQQGLNRVLRENISKDAILRNCIDLPHQEHNQILALDGSRTKSVSTIDLSSASDLLGYKLVKLVFSRCPLFLAAIDFCRTEHVCVDGKIIRLRKYAGMGNATTFPIQSVVFAVICIAAMHQRERITHRSVVNASKRIRVYGDDIIVPTDYYNSVCDSLTMFGLRINRHKSFSKGNFRESCGVDAYAGVNITPVYVRSVGEPSLEPTDMAKLVAASNELFMRGYYLIADRLKRYVEKTHKRSLPYVASESGLLGWTTRTGAQTVSGWDRRYQRLYTKGERIVSRKREDPLSGYPALLAFLATSGRQWSTERGLQLERTERKYHVRLAQARSYL